jgi:hypothetical protein
VFYVPHVIQYEQTQPVRQQPGQPNLAALWVNVVLWLVVAQLLAYDTHFAGQLGWLLPQRYPEYAIVEVAAALATAGKGGSQHRFAYAAHTLQRDGLPCRGDDRGLDGIGQQRTLEAVDGIRARQEVRRQRIHPVQGRQVWQGLLEVSLYQLPQCSSIRPALSKVDAVNLGKHGGQEVIIAQAQDGDHHPARRQRKLPLVAHVVRLSRFWADDQDEPIHGRDGVADLLQKGAAAAFHCFAIPPHVEASRGQITVEPLDEGLVVIAGVGDKDVSHFMNSLEAPIFPEAGQGLSIRRIYEDFPRLARRGYVRASGKFVRVCFPSHRISTHIPSKTGARPYDQRPTGSVSPDRSSPA